VIFENHPKITQLSEKGGWLLLAHCVIIFTREQRVKERSDIILIGVYGGIAAGKSVLLEVMSEQGFLVLDGDRTFEYLMETPGSPIAAQMKAAICERFGPVYDADRPDPEKLGAQVREDLEARRALAAITHRFTMAEMERRLTEYEAAGGDLAATDAPQTFRGRFSREMTCHVLVTAPFLDRVLRLSRREGLPVREAERRVGLIGEDADILPRYILCNDADRAEFRRKCAEFLEERRRCGW